MVGHLQIQARLSKGALLADAEHHESSVLKFLAENVAKIRNGQTLQLSSKEREIFDGTIDAVLVQSETLSEGALFESEAENLVAAGPVNYYRLHSDGPLSQNISLDGGESATLGAQQFELPAAEFDGVWESLHYDGDLKRELLSYAENAIRLSAAANMNVISIQRLAILFGEPGTGKTSLCRALAQQLAIRMRNSRRSVGDHLRFRSASLVELNAHALFSKWFSESGKLVQALFASVAELAEDSRRLVVVIFIFWVLVLIDEAESVAMARSAALDRQTEPTDSVRAVNTLLTQLDQLKWYAGISFDTLSFSRKNVFVLCTSNMSGSLDDALLDRADFVRRVPLPARTAMRVIFAEILDSLQKSDFLTNAGRDDQLEDELELDALAEAADGLSARAIRQLPLAACVQMRLTGTKPVSRSEFAKALCAAAKSKKESTAAAKQKHVA